MVEIEITERMTRLKNASDFLTKECLKDVKFLVSVWDEGAPSRKKRVGDLLAKLEFTKLFLEVWKKYFEMYFLKEDNSRMKSFMQNTLLVLCIYMDSSTELCVQAFKSDLQKAVLNYLKADYLNPSKSVHQYCRVVIINLMAVLHNMLQKVPDSRTSLREYKAFDVFERFRQSPSNEIACRALMLQGYIISPQGNIVSEEESELVNSDDSNFVFLKDVLEKALMPNNSKRSSDGFSPLEVISAINRLAVNDNNKKKIVSAGLLPFYVKLLQPQCSEEEQEAAAKGLWTLAFKCKQEIVNEPGCVDALKTLSKRYDGVKRQTTGALWKLEESQRNTNPCTELYEAGQKRQRHIFISYQWDSKPMIKKIVNSLKEEGFNVWVDIDNMFGSILGAMAQAVEEAAVVIVCFSQKYKESPNCRTEGEYSYQLRKEIVPLRMQSLYQPDGWLGAICGTKLWYDFTSDEKFLESIKSLIRELGVRGKATEYEVDELDSNVGKVTRASVPLTESSGCRIPNYATWTSEEILLWLKANKLEAFQDWFKDFDGTHLMEYKAMLGNAPETFYTILEKRTFSLKCILDLSKALKQL